jgi:uncharacterized protein YqgV (UPF0045/DUF77 family)
MKKVNLAIQVLPTTKQSHPYFVIDKIIEYIANKNYNYIVCPFETVVECDLNQAIELIREIHNECYKYDVESLLINIKIHSRKESNVTIEEKIGKYKV